MCLKGFIILLQYYLSRLETINIVREKQTKALALATCERLAPRYSQSDLGTTIHNFAL